MSDLDPTVPSPRDPDANLVGHVIDGCRIVRLLGRGGMGAVYEGHEEMSDRRVAVKTIRADLVDSAEQAVKRFRNEIRAVAKISSPHVVQLYHAGELPAPARAIYMRMEFIDGHDLAAELEQRPGGRASLDLAIAWMADAARGLLAAERAGVVHRDIKPANLMLRRDGRVVVADFGIATLEDARTRLTGENIIGTLLYMAPEQFDGVEADVRSDIYSLGATFFHAVTGKPPAEGVTTAEVMRQKTTANCTLSPKSGLAGADTAELAEQGLAPFDALIRRMTARDPDRRPQSFADIVEALEAMGRGEVGGGGRPGWVAPLLGTAALAVLALVYLIATGALGGNASDEPDARLRAGGAEGVQQPAPDDGTRVSDGGEGTATAAEGAPADAAPNADEPPAGEPTDPTEGAVSDPPTASDANPTDPAIEAPTMPPRADDEPVPERGTVPSATKPPVSDEPSTTTVPPEPGDGDRRADPTGPETPPRADLASWARPTAIDASGEPTWHLANRYGLAFPSAIVDERRGVTMILVRWDLDRGGEGDGSHWFYGDAVEASWRQWQGLPGVAATPSSVGDDLLPATNVAPREIAAALARLTGPSTALPSLAQWKRMAFGAVGARVFPWGGVEDAPTGTFGEATYGPENKRQTVTADHTAPERVDRSGERNPEGFEGLCTNVREVVSTEAGFGAVGAAFNAPLWTDRFRRDGDAMATPIRSDTRSDKLGFRAVVPLAALAK